jgi:predicted GIY-YIG superfamily endonuclease
MRFIYILLIDDIPFYVGKTKNIKSRFVKHKIQYPESTIEIINLFGNIKYKLHDKEKRI